MKSTLLGSAHHFRMLDCLPKSLACFALAFLDELGWVGPTY